MCACACVCLRGEGGNAGACVSACLSCVCLFVCLFARYHTCLTSSLAWLYLETIISSPFVAPLREGDD